MHFDTADGYSTQGIGHGVQVRGAVLDGQHAGCYIGNHKMADEVIESVLGSMTRRRAQSCPCAVRKDPCHLESTVNLSQCLRPG
jgi:hypothetical protein